MKKIITLFSLLYINGDLFFQGCFDALLEWFKKNSSFLIAALITVLCIEVYVRLHI